MRANCKGYMPVHLAAAMPHSEKRREPLRTLVTVGGADIDRPRLGDGFNASHIPTTNKYHKCLEMCLVLGADLETENNFDDTPQQMAYALCDDDVIHPLVKPMRCYRSPVNQTSRPPSLATVT